MTLLIDTFLPGTKEPEPWDRAAVPPVAPFAVQEKAIEDMLHEAPLLASVPEAPGEFALSEAEETPAAIEEPAWFVEEFKPTAREWENVKDLLRPHPDARPLDENLHPLYRPAILERDADGLDGGGDWNEVETERTEG